MSGAERLAELLRESGPAVVLTGAGISVPSGIPDFRTPMTGLWANVDPMEVAHISVWRRDPARFWSFYGQRFAILDGKQPNGAHLAVAELERRGLVPASSRRTSTACTPPRARTHRGPRLDPHRLLSGVRRVLLTGGDPRRGETLPRCDCGAVLKPDVVLFGELLPERAILRATALAANTGLMLAIGSSLEVWPVAELPADTLRAGGKLAIVTMGPTPYDRARGARSSTGTSRPRCRRCSPRCEGHSAASGRARARSAASSRVSAVDDGPRPGPVPAGPHGPRRPRRRPPGVRAELFQARGQIAVRDPAGQLRERRPRAQPQAEVQLHGRGVVAGLRGRGASVPRRPGSRRGRQQRGQPFRRAMLGTARRLGGSGAGSSRASSHSPSASRAPVPVPARTTTAREGSGAPDRRRTRGARRGSARASPRRARTSRPAAAPADGVDHGHARHRRPRRAVRGGAGRRGALPSVTTTTSRTTSPAYRRTT